MNCAINLFSDSSPLLFPTALLNAPMLSLVSQSAGVSNLAWVWFGTEPDSVWVFETSADGGATWAPVSEYGPGVRTGAVNTVTALVRLYGYNPNTGYSNVVDLSGGVPANAFVDSAGTPFVDSAGNIFTT